MKSNFFTAVAILIGTVIGAGIFGLPYVISKIGFFPGLFYLIILALIITIITLAYADIVLKTETRHQLAGYAQFYLGLGGKIFSLCSLILGITSALTAYLIGIGLFLTNIFGGSPNLWRIIFFIIASGAIYFGLKTVGSLERKLTIFIVLMVIALFIFAWPKITIDHLFTFNWYYLFLPYGVVLFALTGATAVPDMADILRRDEKKLKKAIWWGTLIPLIVYIIFVVTIVGVTGANTSENAIDGLGVLGKGIVMAGSFLGILTMSTSFLTLGLILKEVYFFDLGLNKFFSWLLAVAPPLLLVLANFLSFIDLLGIGGAIISGFDGIIIMLVHQKIKKVAWSPLLSGVIYTIFALGIFYEIYIIWL